MYSDCFINFMVPNMFCNPAAVVRFLLFLFWSRCFNKYIFLRHKRETYAVLDVSNRCCCGWRQNQNAKKSCSLLSLVFIFFICEQYKNAICPNALCLFFQYIKHYFTALLLFFLDLFLLGTFSGKQMELVALKVRHIWTAVNALHCSNLRLQYNKRLHVASKRFAENYHLMLHFPSALQNVLALISSCSRQLFSSKSSTTQPAGIISQHFKLSMVPKSFCYYIALQYN